MFRKKRNGKGMLWASLLSLVVSAVALLALKRDEKGKPTPPASKIQSRESSDIQKYLTLNDRTVLAEFAKELDPKSNLMSGKKDNM